jgi:hypothetical protein
MLTLEKSVLLFAVAIGAVKKDVDGCNPPSSRMNREDNLWVGIVSCGSLASLSELLEYTTVLAFNSQPKKTQLTF